MGKHVRFSTSRNRFEKNSMADPLQNRAIDRIPFSYFTCPFSHRSSFSVPLIMRDQDHHRSPWSNHYYLLGVNEMTRIVSAISHHLHRHRTDANAQSSQLHRSRTLSSRAQPSASFIFMNKNKYKATVKLFINS